MNREFIHTTVFDKQWKALGLGDDELAELQNTLSHDPKVVPVIPGASGVRKVRFAYGNKGKSGSVRVLYLDVDKVSIIVLISAYSKNEKENISESEKADIRALADKLKNKF